MVQRQHGARCRTALGTLMYEMPFSHMSYSRLFNAALLVKVGKLPSFRPPMSTAGESINKWSLFLYQNFRDPLKSVT